MAKLFQPIRFWMARFTCRKSSASSGSSCPRVPRPASSPPPAGGGLSFAVLQAALHPRSALPPPRRSGLRFPTPVGHGRGLASRPGCAAPGEGVDSPWLHLATSGVRRYCSAPPASARLRPASPTPGERKKRRSVPAASPAASRCSPSLATLSACLGYCLAESGGATADQHCCHVHRRQPARLRQAGSRLVFYRPLSLPQGAATVCSSPGFGRCRGKPAWQAVSANTLAHPIIGPLCKVAEPSHLCASTLRCASPTVT